MPVPTLEVNLKEVDELIKKLTAMGEETTAWVADEIAYTALEIESDAKLKCPRITGTLMNSIRALVSKNPISAVIGTNVEYASIVEYGSKILHRRANPYLYPAYWKNIIKLKETLKRAAGK